MGQKGNVDMEGRAIGWEEVAARGIVTKRM
jgi:hypothetical protein